MRKIIWSYSLATLSVLSIQLLKNCRLLFLLKSFMNKN